MTNTGYWNRHNVTSHKRFQTVDESRDYLDWRNKQYLFYDDFIPFDELDGLVVIDYGCGPGHDLVAIGDRSKPKLLIGFDISARSLEEARTRLALHDLDDVEVERIDEHDPALPLDDGAVDYFVSSGVLMICPNIEEILRELHRVLRIGGRGRVMVYNYDSLWMHLYVPYTRQIVQGIDTAAPLEEAFKRSTDGPDCPYSRAYRPDEFVELAERCGFEAEFIGGGMSVHEMGLLPTRFDALSSPELAFEHREFLTYLTFDDFGRPLHNGKVAGIQGFFELRRTA